MRKYLLAAALLMTTGVHAQVGVYGKPAWFAALKKTTTVFVIPEKDRDSMDAFKKVIADVWTANPYRVILSDSESHFSGTAYSVFSLSGAYPSGSYDRTGPPPRLKVMYALGSALLKKNGTVDRSITVAYIPIEVEDAFRTETFQSATSSRKEYEANWYRFTAMLNKSVHKANWGPGYLKGYLKTANDRIVAEKEIGMNKAVIIKGALAPLMTDTLYLPESINRTTDLRTGLRADRQKSREDIIKDYPYPVRFIPDGELNNKIVYATKPFYYLLFTRDNTEKYVSVYEGQSGNLLYSVHHGLSVNFTDKDMEELMKFIPQ